MSRNNSHGGKRLGSGRKPGIWLQKLVKMSFVDIYEYKSFLNDTDPRSRVTLAYAGMDRDPFPAGLYEKHVKQIEAANFDPDLEAFLLTQVKIAHSGK